jgi:ABC-type uncharacterized transport system permease subunit
VGCHRFRRRRRLNSSDLNLVTAVLVAIALILPGRRNPFRAKLVGLRNR